MPKVKIKDEKAEPVYEALRYCSIYEIMQPKQGTGVMTLETLSEKWAA